MQVNGARATRKNKGRWTVNWVTIKNAKEKYRCEHKPLINMELDHVILDELHLSLRILDVLIENLVQDALQWDQQENWTQNNKHLCKLQKTITSIISE